MGSIQALGNTRPIEQKPQAQKTLTPAEVALKQLSGLFNSEKTPVLGLTNADISVWNMKNFAPTSKSTTSKVEKAVDPSAVAVATNANVDGATTKKSAVASSPSLFNFGATKPEMYTLTEAQSGHNSGSGNKNGNGNQQNAKSNTKDDSSYAKLEYSRYLKYMA